MGSGRGRKLLFPVTISLIVILLLPNSVSSSFISQISKDLPVLHDDYKIFFYGLEKLLPFLFKVMNYESVALNFPVFKGHLLIRILLKTVGDN